MLALPADALDMRIANILCAATGATLGKHCLMMTILRSKHVRVIIALTSAGAGVYINILITQVQGYESHRAYKHS